VILRRFENPNHSSILEANKPTSLPPAEQVAQKSKPRTNWYQSLEYQQLRKIIVLAFGDNGAGCALSRRSTARAGTATMEVDTNG